MFSKRSNRAFPLEVVEFVARVGSVASITFLLMLFAGEGIHLSEIAARQWGGLLFFPVGVIIGMAIAWWKEGLGAAISLGSLLGLYLIYGYFMQYHVAGWCLSRLRRRPFCFCCTGCSPLLNKDGH